VQAIGRQWGKPFSHVSAAEPLPHLESPAIPRLSRSRAPALATWLRALRVGQWPKNLLVFAAPAAAGALTHSGVFAHACIAFATFCLLASGAYLVNDVRDVEQDRSHPTKCHRPIAAALISERVAMRVGVAAVLAGIAVAALTTPALLACALVYALLNVAYSNWLRDVAVADIAVIASVFLVRALAGGAATHIPVSRWFVIVVAFGALFVAAGKRYSDFMDPDSRGSRPVLEQYTGDFLRLVLGVACAVALGAYCLWAFETARHGVASWRELTIIPFTLCLLRYGLLVTRGDGAAPEDVIFGDRFIAIAGAAWLMLFALGL
jgi:decaprenyl-phosphate phosphoribosyltransferase